MMHSIAKWLLTKKGVSHFHGIPLDAKVLDFLPPADFASIQTVTIHLSNDAWAKVEVTYIPREGK